MSAPASQGMKAKHQRLVLIGLAVLALIGAGLLAAWALRNQASYFYVPAEITAKPPAPDRGVRLGGMVERGSIKTQPDGVSIVFTVADGKAAVPVRFRGIVPDLFQEGSGVVAEGTFGKDGTFAAERLAGQARRELCPARDERHDRNAGAAGGGRDRMNPGLGLAGKRRSLRFWVSAALAGLIAASAIQLEAPGPELVPTALAVLAALWLALRHPRPAADRANRTNRFHAAARLILLAGLAIAAAAFAISHLGGQRARIAALCEGQSAKMGGWNFALAAITPVAGDGFTALEASLAAQRGAASPPLLKPQLRSWFLPARERGTASRARLWNGDLALRFADYDAPRACMALDASWRPLAGLAQLGGWLAAMGAALMALAALGSLRWRSKARARIAMRREDRPLPGALPAGASDAQWVPLGKVLIVALMIGSIGFFALGGADRMTRSAAPPLPSFTGGPALLAARQSLRETKTIPSSWIVIADAMARHGQFGNAAHVLLGAVEKQPHDPEAWLALGDALYAHAGGRLSPAAVLAYDRADEASMRRNQPPVLAATAFERSGRARLAADWLQRRIDTVPALWRSEVEQRLAAAKASQSGPSTAAPTP